MASKKTLSDFTLVKSLGGISEYELKSNGLRILHMEDKNAPIIAVNITYHVGSRNEAVGYTGSTHILEHLLFQGTKKFNKENGKSVWNLLESVGAEISGTTWFDRTNYYELVPKESVDTALSLEADRMRFALLKKEYLDTEMTVVRNEFERGENSPREALEKVLWSLAFEAHPYHHPTIGWKSDIENITIERLRQFYDTFYHPNNSTLTIIGDISAEEALAKVKKHFGKLPKSKNPIPSVNTTEPKQEGEKRVIVRRAGEQGILSIAHKIPNGRHKDMASIQVLDSVLSSGKSSRLHRALVDTGKATDVSVFSMPLYDDGLFITTASISLQTTHQEVEKIILNEYQKIKKNGITEIELKKAISKNKAAIIYGRDGALSLALTLNEFIAAGDWTLYPRWLSLIKSVTVEDVARVANDYLLKDKSTTGFFIPKK